MQRAAVYCAEKSHIDDVFGCIQEYQLRPHDGETRLNFSLFCALEDMERAVSDEIAFALYFLDVSDGDEAVLRLAGKLTGADRPPEVILVLHSEENVLRLRQSFPWASILLLRDRAGIVNALAKAAARLKNRAASADSLTVRTADGPEVIPYSKIIYIEYQRKRLLFHLQDEKLVESRSIRAPMEEHLAELMADEHFVRTHSAFVVNIEHAVRLDRLSVHMDNGEKIPVAKQRSRQILDRWQKIVNTDRLYRTNVAAAALYCENHSEQLELIRRQPVAQFIVRVDVNGEGVPASLVIMFANAAMCRLVNRREEQLAGAYFYDAFPTADAKWLSRCWESTKSGKSSSFSGYSRVVGRRVKFVCYPAGAGYCCCMLWELKKETPVLPTLQ